MRFDRRIFLLIVLCCMMGFSVTTPGRSAQEAANQNILKYPQYSKSDNKAIEMIKSHKPLSEEIKAAADYFKKNPKSPIKITLAQCIAYGIVRASDPEEQRMLSEQFFALFREPDYANRLHIEMMHADIESQRYKQAFHRGEEILKTSPDDLATLTTLCLTGSNLVGTSNQQSVKPSLEHGLRALELIKADKRPFFLTAQEWETSKTSSLPLLKQAINVLSSVQGKR